MVSPLGLYIHIPFCKKKCPYCAFYKEIWKKDSEDQVIDAIIQDLASYAVFRPTFTTIFLGGCTPSILKQASLTRLFEAIHKHVTLDPSCEITIECNPETITKDTLDTFSAIGITRISLGVQSFIQSELDFLGRWHTPETIHSALHQIRSHRNSWILNIDLMFSLKNSSSSSLNYSLNQALLYAPQHLSTYGLSIEPQTVFEKKNIDPLPDDIELTHYQKIIEKLATHHYEHYEVSAFAKKGYQCQHNVIYWTFNEFIGIGPSASSFFRGHRFTQPSDINAYVKDPMSPFINHTSTPLKESDYMTEYIIALLRLESGICLQTFYKKFGISLTNRYEKELSSLFDKKLLQKTDTHIKKTPQGLFLLNEILITFI